MIDPKALASLAVASGVVTECVMRFFTPSKFDRKRFGLLVSVASGIIVSIAWALVYKDASVGQAAIRGLFVAGTASGIFDAVKTTTVHAKRKTNDC